MYEQAFQSFHMGYAAAMAWVLFLAIMACTALLLITSRRWVHYGGGMS
jgi:multiple sugar transport system permease protein